MADGDRVIGLGIRLPVLALVLFALLLLVTSALRLSNESTEDVGQCASDQPKNDAPPIPCPNALVNASTQLVLGSPLSRQTTRARCTSAAGATSLRRLVRRHISGNSANAEEWDLLLIRT